MLVELIAAVILLGSLFGIVTVLFRKLPVLAQVPLQESADGDVFSKIKTRLRNIPFSKHLSPEKILQKILIKTQKQIAFWLVRLKERSGERRHRPLDAYWQELKKLPKVSFKLRVKKRKESAAQLKINPSKNSRPE